MNDEAFSKRYGLQPDPPAIRIRDDAPAELREGLLAIAEGELHLSPSQIRGVLCTLMRRLPDSSNWSEYPNIWNECECLIRKAEWYLVYDFVERMYADLLNKHARSQATQWQCLVNNYFITLGVGWKLTNGLLDVRGPEAFEATVAEARANLRQAGLSITEQEIHEALRDLSRRPKPDITGAIQHSMAALECTAREAAGDTQATLGDVLKRYPHLLPKPLDQGITKLWGYASEMARHLREDHAPEQTEAELLVSVSAACCSYLSAKTRRGR